MTLPRDCVATGTSRSVGGATRGRGGLRRLFVWGPGLALLLCNPPLVKAQGASPGGGIANGPPAPVAPDVISRDERGRATIRAVRVVEPPVVDGRLGEEVYQLTPAISDFIQQEPEEGQPATERTETWILFDDRNVYVAARCWDSQPDRMVANEMRRDHGNISQNENFVATFDTFHDGRNGFFFETNPLGAIREALVTDEGNANFDWNTVWEVRAATFAQGWTLEMAIPFKSVRYREGGDQIWGVILRRAVKWKNETSFVVPIPASYAGRGIYKFSSAATLVGLEAPVSSLNLELKPYGITGSRTDLTATPAFSNDLTADIGFDAKYGLTRGLIADFTYNTDFAQVEDDDQQVNLTRFSLFFPEKREFFLEGQGIFAFAGLGGRGGSDAPTMFFSRRIGLSSGHTIPIQAGGRVSGRAGPYTVGLLNIQTAGGSWVDDGEEGREEPTNFTVVRMRRDVLRRSTIGFMATNRTPAVDSAGSNQALGFDANFSFYDNVELSGFYAQTHTPGLEGKSASYRTRFEYAGDRYGATFDHIVVEENFNPEIGYLRRSDYDRYWAGLRFSPRPKSSRVVRKYYYEVNGLHLDDGTGRLESGEFSARFETEFHTSDRFNVEFQRSYEYLDEDFEISDGVTLPIGGYTFDQMLAHYQLGPQRRVSGGLNFNRGSFYSGDRTSTGYWGRIEVSPRLSVEPSVSVNWVELPEGKFTTRLVRTRTNFTITPRMLVAALVQYNSSNNSLSTNIRFRWEYRPSSELFVVFTEGRDTAIAGFPGLQNRGLVVKLTRLFRF